MFLMMFLFDSIGFHYSYAIYNDLSPEPKALPLINMVKLLIGYDD